MTNWFRMQRLNFHASLLHRQPRALLPLLAPLAAGLLAGCLGEDPAAPLAPPVAVADIRVVGPGVPLPDPASHATCVTTDPVVLMAYGSGDPAGYPVTFEWRDEVDFGDGTGRHPTTDWGPETNVLRTADYELSTYFFTTSVHYVTLTVHTRDGRSASQTLRVTVRACEVCGGGKP